MTDRALLLLDRATRLPDVSQAFLVAHDRTVLGASNRGRQLPDPDLCLAVYDTIEGMSLYQIDAGFYRWNFNGRTLILHLSTDCIFGVFVDPDHVAQASEGLAAHFREFVADIESGVGATNHP